MKKSVQNGIVSVLMIGICAHAVYAQPLNQNPANGQGQIPAFVGQTRAPALFPMPEVHVTTLNKDLPQGWAISLLPDDTILMTIKHGGMILLDLEGKILAQIVGTPDVDSRGQGGLLDVIPSPDFSQNRRIYFSYAEPRGNGENGTTVASSILPTSGTRRQLEDIQIIFRQYPSWNSILHFGSRLVFDLQGNLYITLGERSHPRPRQLAQDLSTTLGKVVRLGAKGEHLADNPWSGRDDAGRDVWSYGHRNIQSATIDDAGRLWTVEHGPRGGDELNLPEAGKNYGWPVITYGIDYSGAPLGDGITAREGMEQPIYYWDPVIAPSGMAFYKSEMFPEWNNAFLIGGLQARAVVVLKMAQDKVIAEGHIPLQARIRDVRSAADGSIYALLEQEGHSKIVRLTRK